MSTENQIDYQAVLTDLIERRDRLNSAIEAIEHILQVTPSAGLGTTEAQGRSTTLQSDSFFGMTILDATKKYLGMMKRPQSAPEIAKALQDGGYLFNTSTPVNTVTSVLFRDDSKGGEIVRLGKGQFGLAAWYPSRPKRKKSEEANEGAVLNPPPQTS